MIQTSMSSRFNMSHRHLFPAEIFCDLLCVASTAADDNGKPPDQSANERTKALRWKTANRQQ
jgi:hypothetical protein